MTDVVSGPDTSRAVDFHLPLLYLQPKLSSTSARDQYNQVCSRLYTRSNCRSFAQLSMQSGWISNPSCSSAAARPHPSSKQQPQKSLLSGLWDRVMMSVLTSAIPSLNTYSCKTTSLFIRSTELALSLSLGSMAVSMNRCGGVSVALLVSTIIGFSACHALDFLPRFDITTFCRRS